jgi:hypothetical protein
MTAAVCQAAQPAGGRPDQKDVEFRINGQAFGRRAMAEGLAECATYDPDVCPTDRAAGWEMRRTRLMRYVPLRQFLDAEGITVSKQDVDKRIEEMKKEPNPFGKAPPKPLRAVMVRDCMTWGDLRLMLRVHIGMERWARRQWKDRWPTEDAWKEYCLGERRTFLERFGKFTRLSFTLSRWPKGARDEQEAMRLLKKGADTAIERLNAGGRVQDVAQDPTINGKLVAAEILPLGAFGAGHTEMLRELAAGQAFGPIRTRFGWEVLVRKALSTQELSEALKLQFLVRTRIETERKIVSEARIEKVNWMEPDELRMLEPGL